MLLSYITIFHRKGSVITRQSFDNVEDASLRWKELQQKHKGWRSEIMPKWSKKMKTKWGVTILFNIIQGDIAEEVYAIELWDRSLWNKDTPDDH